MATPGTIGYGLPVSPQARKVLPLVVQLLAEGWSAAKLSREAGIALSTAKGYLRTIQDHISQDAALTAATVQEKAGRVALRIRNRQIERAEKVDSEIERAIAAIDDGFVKPHYDAKRGEWIEKRYQYDAATKAKLLGDILRGEKTLDDVMRSLSGRDLAEKALLARVKGEALGKGIGAGVIDALAMELSEDSLFLEVEGEEIAVE